MDTSNFRGGGFETTDINQPKGRTHFLGIAINAYHHFTPLRNAVNDLDTILKVLLKYYDFEEANVTLLKDEKATRKKILNTLYNYTRSSVLGADDKLLIYYAGHGCLDENEDGYWVPVESEQDDIDSFLPNLNVQSYIKNMKCRHVLLISDSCFSGSLLVPGRDSSTDTLIAEKLETRKSRWVITSGGRNDVVSDGVENSPFAKALISELRYNQKAKLTADELALRVRSNTRANSLQIPQGSRLYGAGDDLGQFVFNRYDFETTSWQAAVLADTILDYQTFLKNFPTSLYRNEAEKRILTISDEPTSKAKIASPVDKPPPIPVSTDQILKEQAMRDPGMQKEEMVKHIEKLNTPSANEVQILPNQEAKKESDADIGWKWVIVIVLVALIILLFTNKPFKISESSVNKNDTDSISNVSLAADTALSSQNPEYFKALTFYEAKNYKAALPIYQRLAKSGDKLSQFQLAYMYNLGLGVKKNYFQAANWYLKSAEQGDANAQFNLGVLYNNGDGVKQSYSQAAKWYQKSADQGYASAQYNLGILYYKGTGVRKDVEQAKIWIEKAADTGDSDAKKFLETNYK
ncbi:hypothetical protein GCM10027299_55990 [Larkinella ripae]